MSDGLNIAVLVVNSIAALAGIIAAIIAICGIRQAQKQFLSNMNQQEKAINLSLFDMRNDILNMVEKNNFSFDRNRILFLFDEEIEQLVKKYDSDSQEKENFEILRIHFLDNIDEMAGGINDDNAPNVRKEYGRLFGLFPDENCTQEDYKQCRENVHKYKLCFEIKELGLECPGYSLIDIDDKIHEIQSEVSEIRTTLEEHIREFIRASIQIKGDSQ